MLAAAIVAAAEGEAPVGAVTVAVPSPVRP